MANQIVRRQRNNYLQHFAAGAGALVANPQIIQQAGNLGRFAGNQIREYVNNRQTEYYEGAEEHEDNKRMKQEEDVNMESNIGPEVAMSSTGSGSNGGYRGTLSGNTQTNIGYEKHFHERQYGHSKKLKLLNLSWGLSIYGPRHRLTGTRFPLLKFGTSGAAGGKAPPGLVCVQTAQIYGNPTVNPITPYGNNQTNIDFSENIYSNAVNFYLQDFLDNKLFDDSGTRGLFLQYRKYRLKSFTIEITPKTYHQNIIQFAPNVLNSARNTNGWETILSGDDKNIFVNYKHPWFEEGGDPGYFIHRDIYNTYSGVGGTIPLIPPSADPSSTTDDNNKREQYVIKNLDHNLTYVKSGESFSFTREINAQGNYYFDAEGLLKNMKTPIGNIVNALEGQITDGSNIVRKLPEGFNILIVPGKVRVEMFGEIWLGGQDKEKNMNNGYLLLPVLTTELMIKTTAKWECIDYNYANNTINRIASTVDPLEQAIFDYNCERSIQICQLNRQGGSKEN